MTRKDAIEAIKCNWPDSRYTILREALGMAVKALEDVTDKNVGKMTNADRIRAMSDKELATFISEIADECERNTECNQHCYGCDIEYCVRESCLKWLQQSVEKDENGV